VSRGLFDPADPPAPKTPAPLADRMRPRTLDEVLGQPALAPGALLRTLLDAGELPSLLLYGPPGCGKTTVARLLAERTGLIFTPMSAVLAGVKDLRAAVDAAKERRRLGEGTLLFVDEIHHFNRAQQDALLPHVEDGTVTFVGATTENPSFYVNAALLSRCTTVALEPLSDASLTEVARRALTDADRGLGAFGVVLDDDAVRLLAETSQGDARSLLNRLEALVGAAARKGRERTVGVDEARRLLAEKRAAYDKSGDAHYDFVSALHKSVRGGDPQATLYYLARMLESGEPPLYVARRLVRMAAEDVGLADPQALRVALDATETFRFLGSPEGELALAQAAVYLATAPKSNAVYAAFGAVRDDVKGGKAYGPPDHLKNAPTKLMKQLGRGEGYLYPHDFDDAVVDQDYLPAPLKGRTWYAPSPFGHEKEIAKRMAWWEETRRRMREASAGEEKGSA